MTNQLSPELMKQLAMSARQGDPDALGQLYENLGPALLGFLHHLLQDRNTAEDILHDTFLRLFEGRGNWQPNGNLKPWLFTVARRLALDKLRAAKRHRELAGPSQAIAIMGTTKSPDSDLDPRCLDDLVNNTLATLPPAYATAFHLRIGQEFTYPEMAAICNEPQGTLRSRVHHTLGLLRKAMALKTSKGLNYD